MSKYVLVNDYGEFVKEIDTYNGKLILTENLDEAFDYNKLPGGGEYNTETYNAFIQHHFKDELGDRVTTLHPFREGFQETSGSISICGVWDIA